MNGERHAARGQRAQGTEHRAQGTGHRTQGTEHRAQVLQVVQVLQVLQVSYNEDLAKIASDGSPPRRGGGGFRQRA